MNYLTEIMNAKGLTAQQLSKKTGMSVSNIRRLMQGDNVTYSYIGTIQKLAKALDVKPYELIKGSETMKNKILYSEITKAIEHLSIALRKYSPDSHYLRISLFSRDDGISLSEDAIPPDFYYMTLNRCELETEYDQPIMSENSLIYYAETEEGEKIRKVLKLGGINDCPGQTQI